MIDDVLKILAPWYVVHGRHCGGYLRSASILPRSGRKLHRFVVIGTLAGITVALIGALLLTVLRKIIT
ncbi:hypothetical protein O9992_19180 [Vibrio lentus]|nr:hypothetical protein [Vibrio lentus]